MTTLRQIRLQTSLDPLLTYPDATHIFDGLTVFPTHIAHLQLGGTPDALVKWDTTTSRSEDLFNLALKWIRVDRDLRREQEKARGRERGPKNAVSTCIPGKRPRLISQYSTAKTFFEKYDYAH